MPGWDCGKPLPGLTQDHFLSPGIYLVPFLFLSHSILSRHVAIDIPAMGDVLYKLPGLTQDHFLSPAFPCGSGRHQFEGPYKLARTVRLRLSPKIS